MLSKEEIKHILDLSCLTADDEELLTLQKSLSEMEAFISQIQSAETDDLKIEGKIGLAELRDDVPHQSMSVEDVLANAPKQKQGAFSVPLMMEDE